MEGGDPSRGRVRTVSSLFNLNLFLEVDVMVITEHEKQQMQLLEMLEQLGIEVAVESEWDVSNCGTFCSPVWGGGGGC